MDWASNSLPVPLSPVISTVKSEPRDAPRQFDALRHARRLIEHVGKRVAGGEAALAELAAQVLLQLADVGDFLEVEVAAAALAEVVNLLAIDDDGMALGFDDPFLVLMLGENLLDLRRKNFEALADDALTQAEHLRQSMVVEDDLAPVVEQKDAFVGQVDDRVQFDIALEELLVLAVDAGVQVHIALGVAQQLLVEGTVPRCATGS